MRIIIDANDDGTQVVCYSDFNDSATHISMLQTALDQIQAGVEYKTLEQE